MLWEVTNQCREPLAMGVWWSWRLGGLQLSCLSASSPPASPVLTEPVGTSMLPGPRSCTPPPTCPPPPLPQLLVPLCPAPSHPLGPCFCLLPLLSVPETRCPASPVFKNASFLSGVSLAQSPPRIPGAEASPVSLSPPHHSQS